MLRFFKSKNLLIIILFPVIAVLFAINLSNEIITEFSSENQTLVYKYFTGIFNGKYYFLFYRILIALFLTLNSVFFSRIILNIKLFKTISYLHGFIFLFVLGISIKFTDVLPVLISMTFFLIALNILFNTLRKKTALFEVFNIGFFVSISSFFFLNAICFFPIIFIGLMILRTQNIREWISSVIGLSVPYFISISVYFFINSNFNIVFDLFKLFAFKENVPEINIILMISFAYILFLAFISTFIIIIKYRATETYAQDYLRLFFVFFVLSVLIYFLIPGFQSSAVVFSLIAVSVPLSRLFYNPGRKILKEIFFDLFLTAIIITQFDLSIISFLNI